MNLATHVRIQEERVSFSSLFSEGQFPHWIPLDASFTREKCRNFVAVISRFRTRDRLTQPRIRRACKCCGYCCRSDGTFVLDKLGEPRGESEPAIGANYPRTDNRQYELSVCDETLARAMRREIPLFFVNIFTLGQRRRERERNRAGGEKEVLRTYSQFPFQFTCNTSDRALYSVSTCKRTLVSTI